MKTSHEHKAVAALYAARTTERSQVPLINHIDEGIIILDHLGATDAAKRAFCLHPLFQNDEELATCGFEYAKSAKDAYPVMLVMEYRQWANAWLPEKVSCKPGVVKYEGGPTPGPLPEVRDMLIADKVQNKKDFIKYHMGKHPNSLELFMYFNRWLDVLGVSNDQYVELRNLIENNTVVEKQNEV
jgi:hypothetical protein